MKKKIICVLLTMAMIAPTQAVFAEDNAERIEEIKTQIAELEAELDALQGNSKEGNVIYEDESIVITFEGLEDGYRTTNINFVVENKSDETITLYADETSINGFMTRSALCSVEVAPNKKALDGIRVMETDSAYVHAEEIESIESKFHYRFGDFGGEKVKIDNIVIM